MNDVTLDESTLRSALARLNDVVLITEAEPFDLPGPRILYVNAAFERMTGYSAGDVIGLTPRILQGPRTDRAELRRLRAALESWNAVRVCLTNYRKDGTPFDVEFEIVPVANPDGWYTHWVSVQRDVTERTLAADVLRTADSFDALLEGLSAELMLYTDADGCSICVRRSAAEPWAIQHYRRADDDRPPASLPSAIARVLGAPDGAGTRVIPADTPDYSVRAARARLSGGGHVVLLLWRRVTETWELADTLLPPIAPRAAQAYDRVLAQQDRARLEVQLVQAQKLDAVGRLAGGIAHDFNNLLTVMTGNLEFLRERLRDQLPEEPVELADVLSATERARALVENLLSFSHRRLRTHDAVDVRALISATAALLQRKLGGEIDVVTDVASTGELVIAGDAALLEQVLLNLAFNARDAIVSGASAAVPRQGSVTLSARTVVLDADEALQWTPLRAGRCVELTVVDTGPGMTEAVRASAFDPFFTTKDVGAGSGLGLSSVLGSVTNLAGVVRLEHAVPHGLIVRMRFPASEMPAVAMPVAPTGAPIPQVPTLLFVEDDDAVRNVMLRVLQSAGHTVVDARNGYDALQLAQTMGTALVGVITDVRMPVMDGIEMSRVLRQSRPKLPLLFVSGNADTSWIEEFGANATLLTKPFAPSRLLAAIGNTFPMQRR